DQDEKRGYIGFGALGDRQARAATVDDRRRTLRPDSFRGQPAHSVRYRGRKPELSTAGVDGLADGRSAGGGEEGQDFESHQRLGAGGQDASGGGYRCLRFAELLRNQLRA